MLENQIQAISFDLWGTLIKSHPDYKRARALTIRDFVLHKTLTQRSKVDVLTDIRSFERFIDRYTEVTGNQVPVVESFQTLLWHFGVAPTEDNVRDLRLLLSEQLRLMPPQVINGVAEMLYTVNEMHLDIVLCSNTNLITGANLRRAFDDNSMGLLRCFEGKMIFSDDVGIAKPNPKIFLQAFALTRAQSPKNVLHVGDNLLTDGAAQKVGAQFLLVNHEEAIFEISQLTNYLKTIVCRPAPAM